jgi:hypothetical protein
MSVELQTQFNLSGKRDPRNPNKEPKLSFAEKLGSIVEGKKKLICFDMYSYY